MEECVAGSPLKESCAKRIGSGGRWLCTEDFLAKHRDGTMKAGTEATAKTRWIRNADTRKRNQGLGADWFCWN